MRKRSEMAIARIAAFMGMLLAGSGPAMAGTTYWKGVNTNWNDLSNWTLGAVPAAGDEVIVTNTTIRPSMAAGTYPASGAFASFSVSNGVIITCLGDTSATNEASGGGSGGDGKIHGIGVTIFTTNALINGTLDANGRGFTSTYRGPGSGVGGSTGSHGGRGGQDGPGPTYGSLQRPTALGSTGYSGTGGGAIRLAVTNTLDVNGAIQANGTASGSGGGTGGSVWLASSNFTGTGVVQAVGLGTVGGDNRGPGGGRVAIEYTNSIFSGTVSVAGGQQGTIGYYGDGEPGTLWEPGRAAVFPASGALTVNMNCQYYFPDTNTLYQWDLTVSNAWFEVHGGRVAVSNLTLVNGAFRWDRYAAGLEGIPDMTNFTISGDVVTRSPASGYSTLWLAPGTNVWKEFQVGSNDTVLALGDTNAINEASGGNTGSRHGIGVTIFCTNATVDGTVMADGKGFPTAKGPGYASGGGAHGGLSGHQYQGSPYGSLTQPTALGSGGFTAAGGGAIRLSATSNLTVNGAIRANGIAGGSGSGAGGSVWLTAYTFAGAGLVQAAGLDYITSADNRGGSGGRMAIEYTNSIFSGTISVAGGQQGSAGIYGDGQPGTLWEPGKFFPASGPVTINSSYQYYFPNTNTFYQWNLMVSNAWFEVHGGRLAVSNLTLVNGAFRWDRYLAGQPGGLSDMTNFTLSGDVVLTNTTGYSTLSLVAGSNVWGNLRVSTNSTIYCMGNTNIINEAAGGVTNLRYGAGVEIRCASAVINGTVSGADRGFPKYFGPGTAGVQGNGTSGSHGGRSGDADKTYGRIAWPTALGSGGYSAAAGSAFKLRVDNSLALGGTIDMRGNVTVADASSGGSIWLIAGTLTGNGSILADGGNGGAGNIRSGGGGRVALEYGPGSTFTGIVSVARGTGTGSATGTVFRSQSVTPGASDDDGSGAAALYTSFSTNSFTNGVLVTRTITVWQPGGSMTWTDRSMDSGSNQFNITATYTLTNLPVSTDYYIFKDSVNILGDGVSTNTGASGSLRFSILLDASRQIEVRNLAPVYFGAVSTYAASSVTATSATFNGYLTVTGTAPMHVYTLWGEADGGTNFGAWTTTNDLGVFSAVGPVSTNLPVTTGKEYFYRMAVSNAAGWAWSSTPWADTSAYFLSAGITATVNPATIGEATENATFRISRPPVATSRAVTVYYSVGGDATSGPDYTPIPGTNVTLAAGVTSVTFTVTSIRDAAGEGDEYVIVTVLPDPVVYPAGTPGVATLTITNCSAPANNITVAAGMWTNPAIWDTVEVPLAGQNLTIQHSITNPAGRYPPLGGSFGAFVVNTGVTVTCLGDTNIINEASGGYVGSPHGIGVSIYALSATINGMLDANERGFAVGKGPGGAEGASHGGRSGGGKAPYGLLQQPTALGSGGQNYAGGGAIRLAVANTLTLNGTIRANGRTATAGSSGGSVWLAADTFTGTGVVQALCPNGGDTSDLKGGTGGRVAIEYTSSTFSGRVDVAGGQQGSAGYFGDGEPGTLWEPGKVFPASGPVTINSSCQYYFPNTNTLYQWDLTVSNAWFEVHGGRVAVSNLTLMDGVFGWGRFSSGLAGVSDMTNFTLAGNIALSTNGVGSTALLMPAGVYTCLNLTVGSNCHLAPFGNTGIVNEASGGTMSVRHGAGVTICCTSAVINGTVAGAGLGFPTGTGPGYNGYSGAYGGRGGTAPEKTYGRIDQPTALGSGGYSSAGGSAFKLRTDGTLTLNGTIDMRGNYGGSGGGSGGSLWLMARTLTGGGSILASGGNSGEVRGGGGGRIALEYGPGSPFSGAAAVAGGTTGSTTGTVFRCQSTVLGPCDDAGSANGVSLSTTFSTNSFTNGIIVTRDITAWWIWGAPTFTWTDRCMDAYSNQLNNTATYRLSGLVPNKMHSIVDNGAPMFGGVRTNSGSQGVLQFQVTLDVAHTLQVQGSAPGTIFVVH